jgi:hypothetical protein
MNWTERLTDDDKARIGASKNKIANKSQELRDETKRLRDELRDSHRDHADLLRELKESYE